MSGRMIVAFGILVAFFTLSPPLSAQESKKIRIAYPSNSICCLPLFAALKWKIFEENGLQVEIIQVRSQIGNVALAGDRKSTRLNSSHIQKSRMPSSA